jgi:hypothetical protein
MKLDEEIICAAIGILLIASAFLTAFLLHH